jgi:hypothetical protein
MSLKHLLRVMRDTQLLAKTTLLQLNTSNTPSYSWPSTPTIRNETPGLWAVLQRISVTIDSLLNGFDRSGVKGMV